MRFLKKPHDADRGTRGPGGCPPASNNAQECHDRPRPAMPEKFVPQGAPLWGADGGGSARQGAEGGGQGDCARPCHFPDARPCHKGNFPPGGRGGLGGGWGIGDGRKAPRHGGRPPHKSISERAPRATSAPTGGARAQG